MFSKGEHAKKQRKREREKNVIRTALLTLIFLVDSEKLLCV